MHLGKKDYPKGEIFVKSYRESPEVWDKVWEGDTYSQKDLRKLKAQFKIRMLLSKVKPKHNWNVIDLGCGGGYLSEELYRKVNCQITGIDFSIEAINLSKERLSDLPIKFMYSNLTKTEMSSKSADLIICSGSLEHVKNIESALTEISRLLKQGGILYITTSNKYSFVNLQRIVKQNLSVWKYGYQKNWDMKDLTKLLLKNQIEVIEKEVITEIGDLKLSGFFDKLFSKIFPNWGRYFVLVGRRF